MSGTTSPTFTNISAGNLPISVKGSPYNAVGNGTTDDTTPIQAALTAAGNNGGGVVDLGRFIYYVASSLNVPYGVTLRSETINPGMTQGNLNYYTLPGQIILGSAATINATSYSTIENLIITRSGLSMPAMNDAQAATLISQFSGTAITALGDDCSFRDLLLLGHTLGLSIDWSDGTNQRGGRQIIQRVRGDCTSGILLVHSYDISRLEDCHFWPFLTVQVPGATTVRSTRSGIAFDMQNCDWNRLIGCFAYGYSTTYHVINCSSLVFTACDSDGPGPPNVYGWDIEGNDATRVTDPVLLLGCTANSHPTILNVNPTQPSSSTGQPTSVRTTGCRFAAQQICVHIRQGAYTSVNDTFEAGSGSGALSGGIAAESGTSGRIIGSQFRWIGNYAYSFADAATAANWDIVSLSLAGGTQILGAWGQLANQNSGQMLVFPNSDSYQNPNSWALRESFTIRGNPYGFYDTGTLLSLVATTLPLSSSRAGINGGFEAGVSAIAGYGSFDSVNIYSGIMSQEPPLVLHNVTYDATHIFPQTPLTTAQIALLRRNMWVLTNSIDTTVSTTPSVPNGTPPLNVYGSYVTGWATDGSSITVVGWTVPGSGHTAAGQVPPVGTLKPGAANATAYLGARTNVFGGNFVAQHDPVNNPDSQSYAYQGIEFDFQNFSTVDYQMGVQGLSLGYTPMNGTVKATADSYGLKLDGFPTGMTIGYTYHPISAGPLNVYWGGSPPPWAGTPSLFVQQDISCYIDSNLLHLVNWVSRDNSNSGWQSASVHLGLWIDSTLSNGTITGGSQFAQIVWNAPNYLGGLQLQNSSGVAGLAMDLNAHILLQTLQSSTSYANDAAAAAGGVVVGQLYRNGSAVQIRIT